MGVTTTKKKKKGGNLLISIRAYACCFIVFCTIAIRTIVETTISFSYRTSSSLIIKMPMKACEWPMISAFVLEKLCTLLYSELLQIAENAIRFEINL